MPRPIMDNGRIPGPVFIDECFALRLYWELPNDKTAFNVLHASGAGPGTLSQAYVDALFTAVKTAFTGSAHDDDLDTETSLTAVGLRDMSESSSGSGVGLSEWKSSGAAASGSAVVAGQGPMPHQVAFCVSLKTGFSGQANRGRVFLPGYHMRADDGNGLIKEATANKGVAFIQAIADHLETLGLALCLAHPARKAYTGWAGAEHPARDAGTVPVLNITKLNLQWDTQRLRARL